MMLALLYEYDFGKCENMRQESCKVIWNSVFWDLKKKTNNKKHNFYFEKIQPEIAYQLVRLDRM